MKMHRLGASDAKHQRAFSDLPRVFRIAWVKNGVPADVRG